MYTFYFYFDVGEGSGLGHAMRCHSLGLGVEKLGAACTYLMSANVQNTENLPKFLSSAIECQPTPEAILSQCGDSKLPRCLVLDSYCLDVNLFDELNSANLLLVCFDDLIIKTLPVDVVINGFPSISERDYKLFAAKHALVGPKYQVIRSDLVRATGARVAKSVSKILITIGGSDKECIIPELIELCLTKVFTKWPEIKVDLVLGPFAPIPLVKPNANIRIHNNPLNFSELLCDADMAISAGGQTLLELIYCGIPTIGLGVAKNQTPNLDKLSQLKCIKYIGQVRENNWQRKLIHEIDQLIGNPNIRDGLVKNSLRVFDGKGNNRIAMFLVNLLRDFN